MVRSFLPPGFRFHPTDVELVMYFLKRKIMGRSFPITAISGIDLYNFDPRDLPGKSWLQRNDLEWYFFCSRARKYATGLKSNRATINGIWKATGGNNSVCYNSKTVGWRKTLVFHEGKAPKGHRTDRVMHEYRIEIKVLVGARFSQVLIRKDNCATGVLLDDLLVAEDLAAAETRSGASHSAAAAAAANIQAGRLTGRYAFVDDRTR